MRFLTSLILLFLSLSSFAQAPDIIFQNTVGGDDWEFVRDFIQSSDGGYVLVGDSRSNASFDKSENNIGSDDIWVVKLDNTGALEWENTIGGTLRDLALGVEEAANGEFIVAGWTASPVSGDITEPILGGSDCFIFKLNSSGEFVWQKYIGGDGFDSASSIQKLSNGNFLIGALSNSDISGEKTENGYGENDFWVFEIDTNGDIIWQKTVGAALNDVLYDAVETPDGSIILMGSSNSPISGDKTEDPIGTSGREDYWAIKLDTDRNVVWDNTVGGDFVEGIRGGIGTADNGCLIIGWSLSDASGDKSEDVIGDLERADYWVIKLNADGSVAWENTIGGDSTDNGWAAIQLADGSFVIGGESSSDISGDKDEDTDFIDIWILGLNPDGEIQWQNTIGGDNAEYLYGNFILNESGNLVMAGSTSSAVSGDVTDGANEGHDYWIVEMGEPPILVTENTTDVSLQLYPNPSSEAVNLRASTQIDEIIIYNALGQFIQKLSPQSDKVQLDVSNFSSGLYYANIKIGAATSTKAFIID